MKILAIIPTRGAASVFRRRISRNSAEGLLLPTVNRAASSPAVSDEVMVSTDSEEIAAVAREYSAGVPFMRSAKAADDYATTADVLLEVLDEYERRGCRFDAVACIYATAPLSANIPSARGLPSARIWHVRKRVYLRGILLSGAARTARMLRRHGAHAVSGIFIGAVAGTLSRHTTMPASSTSVRWSR